MCLTFASVIPSCSFTFARVIPTLFNFGGFTLNYVSAQYPYIGTYLHVIPLFIVWLANINILIIQNIVTNCTQTVVQSHTEHLLRLTELMFFYVKTL